MLDVERVPTSQITTVYNGMDVVATPRADHVGELRRELSLGTEPIILVVARLHEEKGHRYLFDAIPLVNSRIGPVQVLLAGEGPHDGEIRAAAQTAGVAHCVRFLGRVTYVP
jgi:glycosyltransferase involved in cell wall biosynthesis